MSALDMLAVIIALASSIALIITSAIQNARLTRSRDTWRADCLATLEKLHACEEALLRR